MKILLFVLSLGLLGVGCLPNASVPSSLEQPTEPAVTEDSGDVPEETMEEGVETEEADTETDVTIEEGTYTDYSESALEVAHARGDDVVLFFYAGWCPFCRATDAEFLAQGIPSGVTVLKTDYDSERELKDQYAVTYQHTFVQVDAQGAVISRWVGGGLAELEANVE